MIKRFILFIGLSAASLVSANTANSIPDIQVKANSRDAGFVMALKSALPDTYVILSNLYWAKKCTIFANDFSGFSKSVSSTKEYGKLLTLHQQKQQMEYLSAINKIRSRNCK